jgi:glycosyltransferase involved in cell wall biosynthesis
MRVSIIITSYNYGLYIERCLRSCLHQNFPAHQYEIIIVDDASTDQTVDIVQKYKTNKNVRLLINEENLGVAATSNRGIRESFGQFVVRVDADDYVNSNFILFLTSYLEANNELLGVACDYVKVNDDEQILERFSSAVDPISCGILYRKDLLVAAGLYDADFRHCEEKELRTRLGPKYAIDHLRIPLYRYRMHAANKTKLTEEVERYTKRIALKHDR